MTLDWISQPVPWTSTYAVSASEVTVTVITAPFGFIEISAEFNPRKLGRWAFVQVYLVNENGGSYPATPRVQFFDDGGVRGYGDRSNGVRFKIPPYNLRAARGIFMSVVGG